MRVGYVLPYLERPSGWRSHSLALIHALEQKVEPVLFTAEEDAEQAKEFFPGCMVYPLPSTQKASLRSWHGATRLWKTNKSVRRAVQQRRLPPVDLVHSLEAYPTGLVGSWLASRMGCPHILTSHGTYGLIWRDSPPDRFLYEQVLRKASAVLPVSRGTAQLMHRYFGQALEGVRVQPVLNGNNFYQSVPAIWVRERAFPHPPTVLTVGDVKPRKGQHASLAAFAQVQKQFPEARYEFIGRYRENEYYQGLQQSIAALGLQGVQFLGVVSTEELYAAYKRASVFVLAPQPEGLHVEGFGLVYLEAGAFGLPVVGTCTGGIPDAVLDGETGLLVEPGDTGSLADAILRLLSDPEMARRLGQANRQRSEELTWDRCAEEHIQVYRDVV